MSTIIVQGRQVPVSDNLFRLSPQEQEDTVKQIADRIAWNAITGTPGKFGRAGCDKKSELYEDESPQSLRMAG